MTAVSYTGTINTNGTYETVESLTELTLTSGKTYTIQIQNIGYIKIADAEFCVNNQIFTFTQGDDDLYFKSNAPAIFAILENA